MIQIAILGLGTVGTGVARVVAENARQIERKLGEPLQVKSILVRHFKDGPYRQLMTDDFRRIEEDESIRVVVETIGGVDAAYEYTRRALEAGKHVVTANKQLVAERGFELLALAKKKNVSYLFEASVGGGIPILHPLTQCMAANRIDEVYGILNGTSNYILTRMVRTGAFFTDALREAQAKGYAEADPTADVEGVHPCRPGFWTPGRAGASTYGGNPQIVPAGCKNCPAGGIPHQASGAGSPASGRRAYSICRPTPDFRGEPRRQRGGRIQCRGGPGERHR